MSAAGVLNWPWEHVQEVLRTYGPEIALLAARGDPLARKVRQRYQYAYDHPRDPQANLSLRDALNEYLQRDLRDAEKVELRSRFGHQLSEPAHGARIVVPTPPRRQ